MTLNKIRGALFGGAVGDALGYPVEFMSGNEILRAYGDDGITAYDKDKGSGLALISDDTQMTLFTAYGVIRAALYGKAPHEEVGMAYLDWLTTQTQSYAETQKNSRISSWLLRLPELFSLRAPGNTCLNALRYAKRRGYPLDVMQTRMNTSKGCGGVMRIAPLALLKSDTDIKKIDYEGAALSALTHGLALGFMPAAVVTHILRRIVYPEKEMTLKEIVTEARDTVAQVFSGYYYLSDMIAIINKAVALSENDKSDEENIRTLGEGWVAEETLAIALYCSLRYQNDFSKGVTVAVNHDGDSDSTGAVTGNILGALVGYDAIDGKWKTGLELSGVILQTADDIYTVGNGRIDDAIERKYMDFGKTEAPIFFWHEYKEYGFFSNWYESPFVIDDFRYLHVEQYIMAQKAKLFHDAENYTAILRADTPDECKKLGKAVTPYDDTVWAQNRARILKEALTAKFSQNPTLRKMLLETGNSPLAEASPYDSIFGIGMYDYEAKKVAPQDWKGQNLLGKALMELRRELRDGTDA